MEGTLNNITKSANDTLGNIQESVNEFSKSTSSNAEDSGFFTANGLIAKFGFLILVIIIFLILLNLGIQFIYYLTSLPTKIVYVIKGMVEGNISRSVLHNKYPLYRSNNEQTGIEFTWSVWLKLDGFASTTSTTTYSPIFIKGTPKYKSSGESSVSNGPGVYFLTKPATTGGANQNSIHILMDTVATSNSNPPQHIDIENIPISKWFNLCIRCENKYLDIYVNGVAKSRLVLNNVPLQNYDNVQVCGNGGFVGKLSNLIYYSRALNIVDINGIISSGPDTSPYTDNGNISEAVIISDYLSTGWYS